MTVQPIILDIRGPGPIIIDPNIASMTIPCANVDVSAVGVDICTWIASKGGWVNLAVFDVMTLISAYLGQTNLGFTVTLAHIMGGVAYYLDNPSSGDSLTGCLST